MTLENICVWPELLPSLFPTSHYDYKRLWEIIKKENYVWKFGELFALIVNDPISLHVECCEGKKLTRSALRVLDMMAMAYQKVFITCEVQFGGRVHKLLSKFGFFPMWRTGNLQRLMKKV